MAKGNMLLGYARGKVGSLVFARRKGEQITRARNFAPANPRTNAQMSQRMKMYAPVQLYRQSMRRFFKFAFNTAAHETIFNAYMRENIAIAPWVSKALSVQQAAIPFPAKMSSGGVVGFTMFSDVSDLPSEGLGAALDVSEDESGVYTSLPDYSASATLGTLSQEILAKSSALQIGDQITFVLCVSSGLSIENGDVLAGDDSTFLFKYAKFILDPNSTRTVAAAGLHVKQSEKLPGMGLLGIYESIDGAENPVGACVIVTRNDGSSVVASNSTLKLNEPANEIYNLMRTDAYREKAALSYKASPDAYLNPATTEV